MFSPPQFIGMEFYKPTTTGWTELLTSASVRSFLIPISPILGKLKILVPTGTTVIFLTREWTEFSELS